MYNVVSKVIGFGWRIATKIIRIVRGRLVSLKISASANHGTICFKDAFVPVHIRMGKGAKFILRGELSFDSYLGSRNAICIQLDEDSTLEIGGDFVLGPGCRILVSAGASLYIGGRGVESAAGITENTLILVRKRVRIGTDLICAWGCLITDCDWHEIEGKAFQADTTIGDHVWIAGNCSVLKGTQIGNGCILYTGSVAHKAILPNDCLGGGVPFRVLAENRKWHRDLPSNGAVK